MLQNNKNLEFSVGDKGCALGDIALEFFDSSLKKLLLEGRDGAQRQNLLNAVAAELNRHREERHVAADELADRRTTLGIGGQVHKGTLGDGSAARCCGLNHVQCETRTGVGHGKRGRTGAILSLDNLVTAKLNPVSHLFNLVLRQLVRDLAQQGQNRHTAVATDDGHLQVGGVGTNELGHERRSADEVEGGDAKDAAGVVHAVLLEHFRHNRDRRVDRVRDNAHERLGRMLRRSRCQVAHNARIDLEQVIAGHARLAGNAGRNDNHVRTLDSLLQLLGSLMARHLGLGVDVAMRSKS